MENALLVHFERRCRWGTYWGKFCQPKAPPTKDGFRQGRRDQQSFVQNTRLCTSMEPLWWPSSSETTNNDSIIFRPKILRTDPMDRFNFSLRTLLAAVAAVGIGAALWVAESTFSGQ